MKRRWWLLALLLSFTLLPLSARAYVGVNQGLVSSGVEVGYMTRLVEQNLSLSLPLLSGDLTTAMASVNVAWRIQRFNPLVIGLGLAGRVAWRGSEGYIPALGFLFSLSWETLGKGEVLFIEGSYMPFMTEEGSPLGGVATQQVGQWLRIGWRHLF
ncbi:MAG: hypothetical protein RBS49_05890 [Sphaerochaeta sp.]|nr:hypothetical protein [Sphaerochaeta sp.]MDX9915406.1 hypothetical protein [Sphaerochaeta sp.]